LRDSSPPSLTVVVFSSYRATDFSADVSAAVIKFESKAIAETLVDIRKAIVNSA
jgi:hypothetical protein